nr:MAG TPA: hypothetical protein [Caudoviricetes sp.]
MLAIRSYSCYVNIRSITEHKPRWWIQHPQIPVDAGSTSYPTRPNEVT